MKRYLTKKFSVEKYNKPPMRNYPTSKLVYYDFDEIRSIDLPDMIDCKSSNSKGVI